MRKLLVLVMLLVFNSLFIFGINYAIKIMVKNNFIISLKENKDNIKPSEDETIEETIFDTSFGGESIDDIALKFEKVFYETYLEGYGEFMVKNAVSKNVNPYLIGAIILENTNCRIDCSILLKQCNNPSGMRERNGSGCFGGTYKLYKSLDDGIMDLIKKISIDYNDLEMQNPDKMFKSYGKDDVWAFKVNKQIELLKRGS